MLLVGTMVATGALLANVALSIETDSSTVWRWLTVPLAAMAGGLLSVWEQGRDRDATPGWPWLARLGVDPIGVDEPEDLVEAAPPAAAVPATGEPETVEVGARGVTLQRLVTAFDRPTAMTAAVVAVVALGGGGLVAGSVVRYGMDWVTGNEHGPDRFAGAGHLRTPGIKLVVIRIEETTHYTRITLEIDNMSDSSIGLPLGEGNAAFTAGDGTALDAEPLRSDWVEEIGPGSTRRGTITFNGHVPGGANRARLTFTKVFGTAAELPDSITISGIRLSRTN